MGVSWQVPGTVPSVHVKGDDSMDAIVPRYPGSSPKLPVADDTLVLCLLLDTIVGEAGMESDSR